MRHAIALALLVAAAGTARAQADCHSNVIVVLDRSCSMNMPPQPGGAQTKWVLAVAAINKLTTKYSGKLDFGLIMFPDETGDSCKQDGNIYVNVGPGKEAAIAAELARTMPTAPCTTPIKPGIDQVTADPVYKTPFTGSGRRSFVLFISDGKETCGGGETEIVASIGGLYTNGYPTYVVGFGGGVDPAGLTKFSTAGGVPRNTMADAGTLNYYQADSGAQLEAALDAIAGEVVSIGEFGTCLGTPCPDGRCFGAGETCIDGSCIGPSPDGGGGGDGGNGNGDGGGNGAGGGTGGCGCRMGESSRPSPSPDGARKGESSHGPGLGVLFALAVALGLAARRRRC